MKCVVRSVLPSNHSRKHSVHHNTQTKEPTTEWVFFDLSFNCSLFNVVELVFVLRVAPFEWFRIVHCVSFFSKQSHFWSAANCAIVIYPESSFCHSWQQVFRASSRSSVSRTMSALAANNAAIISFGVIVFPPVDHLHLQVQTRRLRLGCPHRTGVHHR